MFRTIKPSFTLIELILVVVIMGVVYILSTSMVNLKSFTKKSTLTFFNLHDFLKEYSYENEIALKCTLENGCFIFSDNSLVENIENLLFNKSIDVYSYDKTLDKKEFRAIELEDMEYYDIVFEYRIDKHNKSKDMIIEADEKVYILNSFNNEVTRLEYLSDVNDYFDKRAEGVRDAF
jgi:prepilin-type N-terminal cleavage/methylation domain-containing protein